MKLTFVTQFHYSEISALELCDRLEAMLAPITREREIFRDEHVMLEGPRTGIVRVMNGIVTRERKDVMFFALFLFLDLLWRHGIVSIM